MTDVIDFLERMGQDAQLRNASLDDLQQALNSAEIAPELQTAILAGNQEQLKTLLNQGPLCVALFPGKEDEEDGDEDEEKPPREPENSPEHSILSSELSAA
jgi:hypothetical protein